MIVYTALLLAAAPPTAVPPAPPAPPKVLVPPAPPIRVAAPPPPPAPADPTRIAAAQKLLDATHIEAQYDQILSQMVPLMSAQIFGTMKDNVTVPPRLRAYLSDPKNEAAAAVRLAALASTAFRKRYPQMRAATAVEYARIFTADELNQLAAFYATALGQKALASLPHLQTKLMPIGMAAGQAVGREAMTQLIEELALDDGAGAKS